ncbi:MAG: glycosyltransferase family 4 protein [Candidatus Falkowbacteria bacterium]
MKIASIVCAFPPYPGGIGNSAERINNLLAGANEITTFTPVTLKPWLHYGHGAFLPQLFWKLNKFDYIYLHYPFFGSAEVVWFFKLFFSRPKLIIQYHMDVRGLNPLGKLLSIPSRLIRNSLLNQADTIICGSLDYIKSSQIKDYYETHKEKFQEIPFGLDIKKFQPKLINRHLENKTIARAQEIVHYINDKFIKRDRLNLLFVGGLDSAHYFKGVEVLLNSLVILCSRNWRLKIVGDGNLRARYESLAHDLKIEKQIEFVGKIDEPELIRSFQNADLFILPSINSNEAFGLVLIEALACGVPVIASNLPGVRQVFTDHVEGLLVEPGSVSDLKEKIDSIFKNEEMRREMALSARRLAEKKYDNNQIKKHLENIFK